MNFILVWISFTDRQTDGRTESDAYEPTVQHAQVGSKRLRVLLSQPVFTCVLVRYIIVMSWESPKNWTDRTIFILISPHALIRVYPFGVENQTNAVIFTKMATSRLKIVRFSIWNHQWKFRICSVVFCNSIGALCINKNEYGTADCIIDIYTM